MAIAGHIFALLILLILSSDLAAIAGDQAQRLQIPGSALTTFTPLLVVLTYLLGQMLVRSKRWKGRVIQFLVVPVMVYPAIIYRCFSHSIDTQGTISPTEFDRFRSDFEVPAICESELVSFRVTVAARDFRPEMVQWLDKVAAVPHSPR